MVKQRHTKPLHLRRPHNEAAAAGFSSVLANVANATSNHNNNNSNNNDQVRNYRPKRVEAAQKTRDSDDTDENELQLGLGGLYLQPAAGGGADGRMQKPKRLLKPASKKTKAPHPRNALLPVKASIRRGHEGLVRRDRPLQPPPPPQGGLMAFAHQQAAASHQPRTQRPAKAIKNNHHSKEAKVYPIRSRRINGGYDAEEDLPAAKLVRQQRPRRVPPVPPRPAPAPGLLSMFSNNENVASRTNQSQQDNDMDWLCSRLDQQCSIDEACKKRSAAPLFLVNALSSKRIDQKATPAKTEHDWRSMQHGEQNDHKESGDGHSSITSWQRPTWDIDASGRPPTSLQPSYDSERALAMTAEELPATQETSSFGQEMRHAKETQDIDHGGIQEDAIADSSHFHAAEGSALKHCESLNQNVQAATKQGSVIVFNNCDAAQDCELGQPPLAAADMDYGCIFTYGGKDMAQVSPITLASPLLYYSHPRTIGSANFDDDGLRMDIVDDDDDGADADTEVDASKSSIRSKGRLADNKTVLRGKMNDDELAANGSAGSGHTTTTVEPLKYDNETDKTSPAIAGICHEATSQRSQSQHDRAGRVANNADGPKISIEKNALLSEPLREGALRRSRRPRKQTDRLSIEFGGDPRNHPRTGLSLGTSSSRSDKIRDGRVQKHSAGRHESVNIPAKMLVERITASSEHHREGAVRRSRRHRKQTDRLSIGFGGDPRNRQTTRSIPLIASYSRGTEKDMRVQSQPASPRENIHSSASSIGDKTQRTSHARTKAVRRSKRGAIPTAFLHDVNFSKVALTIGNRGQHQKVQGIARPRDSRNDELPSDHSVEDDFFADSSTETESEDEEHVEVGVTRKTQATSKNDASDDGMLPAQDDDPLPPDRATKRLKGFRIAARKPPPMKKNFLQRGMAAVDWTSSQLEQLHQSYNQVDPLSTTFWHDVSCRVDEKSSSECQAMWFSLAKTPNLKRNKPRSDPQSNIVEDDIFNATPARYEYTIPPKPIQGIAHKLPMQSVANIGGLAQCSLGTAGQAEQHLPHLRHGYKKYLQDMRRDVNRAEKTKTKLSTKAKPVRHIADQDHHVNMKAKLTPGGTLEIRHQEAEVDEWDEEMYDADEEMMDTCA